MKTKHIKSDSGREFQLSWDGAGKVWVNSDQGMAVGRYNPVAGLDIHLDAKEQLKTGRQCLDCGPGTFTDFVVGMKRAYGLNIPENLISGEKESRTPKGG